MLKIIFSKRMLITLVMGFSSGFPLLLTSSTLQAWMKDAQLDLGTIGLINLAGIPYSWKFLWAPLFDRFTPFKLGRRRSWLLISQIGVLLTVASMSLFDPTQHLKLLALAAVLVAFFSASQDIIIDSYRVEFLPNGEQGLGSSMFIYGYRIAMLTSGAGSLFLADHLSWPTVYQIMSLGMVIALFCTLLISEPSQQTPPPRNFKESVIDPFVEFFKRQGAWTILAFILLYKFGDAMATSITMPFYRDLGFSKSEIGAVTKLFGFWATLVGTFLGGLWILRLQIKRSLLLFGVFQAISTLGFAVLALYGHNLVGLSVVILLENLSGGMGTAAFMAFMATQTNKKFTATQYALFTSIMGTPRTLFSSPSGYLAQSTGWVLFFIICSLIALPALWLIRKLDT